MNFMMPVQQAVAAAYALELQGVRAKTLSEFEGLSMAEAFFKLDQTIKRSWKRDKQAITATIDSYHREVKTLLHRLLTNTTGKTLHWQKQRTAVT
jgi:hypothetical protein